MKKMLSVILCVLMLSGMCACGGSNSNQASQTPVSPGNSTSEIEEITFSLGDVSGTGTFLEQNAQFFSQKVSELSDGKMKVEIFSDGLLGTEDALMTNIQTGALEMANFSSTFTNLVKSAGMYRLHGPWNWLVFHWYGSRSSAQLLRPWTRVISTLMVL